jgi:HD-GYP domain-containing protein (c-di-GMP phosphodiesterase class II)
MSQTLLQRIEKLVEIGIALSAEKDTQRLMEMILLGAKAITNADAGTLYSVTEDGHVAMEIMRTDSMNFAMGGTTGRAIPFPPIALYDAEGRPNERMVVTYAVLHDTTVNIPDAYDADGFDFSGTRDFDKRSGYRSRSFLTVPMKNHEGDVIGVLQLINAQDEDTGEVIPFSEEAERLTRALASQAAIALTNKRLLNDLQGLFTAFIHLIATAIDEKSPHTGEHCRRVPVLTMMLAEAAHASEDGPFREFRLSDEDRYELEVAAWLHDCGKITTPDHVMDKATKLETRFDRIALVEARFEVLRREAEIALLQCKLAARDDSDAVADAEAAYAATCARLADERAFLRGANLGAESMTDVDQARVQAIAAQTFTTLDGDTHHLLTEDEAYNLCITRGTLNPRERQIINNHIVATLDMLEALPFPKHLRRVPEYAGGHHERMDGKGYPRGLKGEQMSLQARIVAIADVFEALTAADRPYKPGKPLSETLAILAGMAREGHIDPDLYALFVREQVYLKYAQQYLDTRQLDHTTPVAPPMPRKAR